jgi:hypothetical protein
MNYQGRWFGLFVARFPGGPPIVWNVLIRIGCFGS